MCRWGTAEGLSQWGVVSTAPFVCVGCPHPALAASKPLQRKPPHTHQVLQLEEPVPELEGLASTPDRHIGHPAKYNSALEDPLEERLQLTWAR